MLYQQPQVVGQGMISLFAEFLLLNIIREQANIAYD